MFAMVVVGMTLHFSIVYADDDANARTVLKSALVERGIDVRTCESGAEVIALCRERPPDAALLSIDPPRDDAFKTARTLRSDPATAQIRLVALTGQGTWDLRTKALEVGFDEFVVKPVPVESLLRALRAAA